MSAQKSVFFLLILVVFLLGCEQKIPDDGVLIVTKNTKIPLAVELANSDPERMKGLMNRTYLGENSGMLFAWPDEQMRNFWMKNTLIPLDMIFITSQGKIVTIQEALPCRADPCMTYPSSSPAQFVLEVDGGFSKEHSIGVGDMVLISNTLLAESAP